MKSRSVLAGCCLIAAVACDEPTEKPTQRSAPTAFRETIEREPLKPIPQPPAIDSRLASLGRRLFHDKRLSADQSVACSSCHDLANGGDDGRPRSLGVQGKLGAVNAPTVFNAGLNFVQFWDGRATTLEDQVSGPVTHPLEMNSKWDDVVSKIKSDAEYMAAFSALYEDGVSADNIRKSIAAFERTLLTPGAPFDRWLAGNTGAISATQRAGYELFKSVGCVACHQGANVGGNMFQRFGVFGDYFKERGNITDADYGRFNVTHNESDRFVFRVPSLRMVAHTAPYFHDGSAKTLTQAVQVMAKYQLGRNLSGEQVDSIVAFLESLSQPGPALAVAR